MVRILIVDDEIEILKILKPILMEKGFKVETVSNTNDIYFRILSFDPQIIMLDVSLKYSDGRNICQSLKNQLRTKNIPIILCSAFQDLKNNFIEYGAVDFFDKPFNLDRLVNRLTELGSTVESSRINTF